MSSDGSGWNNPYQTSQPEVVLAPTADKPTSMVVFGILNLVFGMMGLCGLAVAIGMQMVELPKDPDNIIQQMVDNPSYARISMVLQAFSMLPTTLLLVSGIGLINGKAFGRTLAIVYALINFVLILVMLGVNIAYIAIPVAEQAGAADGPQKAGMIGGAVGILVGGTCPLVYPIVLLIFMYRAPVVNYFRARESAA